ncbi:MAG: hypothetical protein F6K25_05505 [Okeania sp. SIO2G4]|uniref:hypothetical protein n=1 Tax=unclassified Okeania TaxID=2634635 RepID=UPI0013BE4874|nr:MULTISPECIES: hypothetical protein [unclassified Okeania]NEP07423.1 hypothetical protein [Okeania sp. SIO4D6]NEP38535.1 hypothetical protein [Okeania sp. SIO2H7]NEP71262.1 hypothetical protein [Okeania sp. SIO2G5]NEP96938.1 hypothetical protein [Okeania sp. SIO2F5]NEQ90205.1 hypothetical protein [Okeania sp. SIO2G4]
MTPNPAIITAVENLDYRVTVGDVVAKAGLDVKVAEQGLLALATDAGGHLQVSETGEIAYLFPKNFRGILRNKFWRLRWREWWEKVWRVLFYLIRISFGILLILSLVIILAAITIIVISLNSSGERNDSGSRGKNFGGGMMFLPRFWFNYNWFLWFNWGYYDRPYRYQRQRQKYHSQGQKNGMNFFEAVFSFLFGDGNPNYNLDERRWQAIATVIKNNQGAVVAEQIAPYLDDLGKGYALEYEEYILPVLIRFNGRPEVSSEGQIVYHFPELQATAKGWNSQPISAFLKEKFWRFSEATSGQIMLATGLGAVNFVGALVLGSLLEDGTVAAQLGGFISFVEVIYPLLLVYGVGFLVLPLIRYFWVQWRNGKVEARNQQRQKRVITLNHSDRQLKQKIEYAKKFASETIIGCESLAYTTEKSILEQEAEQADKIDAEWQKRLNQSDAKE